MFFASCLVSSRLVLSCLETLSDVIAFECVLNGSFDGTTEIYAVTKNFAGLVLIE